jgi:hypothetical protein
MANAGVIQYDVQRNWTVTNDNAVGATTDVGTRPNSVLPHPSARSTGAPDFDAINKDDDASTIYFDPANGNDGNAGTDLSSDAVLTLGRAEDLMTATRHVMHIERTDSAITTTITDVSTITATTPIVGATFDIQVASGQTVTLIMDGVDTTISGGAVNGGEINGFIVTSTIALTAICPGNALGTGIAKYCTITAPDLAATGGILTYSVDNCLLIMTLATSDPFLSSVTGSSTRTLNMRNNILAVMNYAVSTLRKDVFNLRPSQTGPVVAATKLGTCEFNTFYNIGNYLTFIQSPGTVSAGQDLISGDHQNNIIFKADTLIIDDNTPGDVLASNYDMDWILTRHGSKGLAVLGSNVIEERSPLFRDVINLDFTPAHVSDTFNDVSYPISSPAIDTADDGTDLGAIQRTFTEIAESSTDHELIDCGYQINEMPTRINYQQFDNIQGAAFDTWDDMKSELILSLKKEFYVGHEQAVGIDRILRSKLAKRFYPNGTAGMLDADLSITVANDTTTNIVTCTIPQASTPDTDILPRWFNGWVIKLDWSAGVSIAYYQITNIATSGTDEIVTAEFLRGDALGSTTPVDFNIMYMPIILNMKKLDLKSDFYNSDIKTWLKDATVNTVAEFHTNKIVMKQSQEFLNE